MAEPDFTAAASTQGVTTRPKLTGVLEGLALLCCLAPVAVVWRMLTVRGVHWSLSNTVVLTVPGTLSLVLVGAATLLERRRLVLRGAIAALGCACLYAAVVLDRCVLLTDYNRWLRRGMPEAPVCGECPDAFARGLCERVAQARR